MNKVKLIKLFLLLLLILIYVQRINSTPEIEGQDQNVNDVKIKVHGNVELKEGKDSYEITATKDKGLVQIGESIYDASFLQIPSNSRLVIFKGFANNEKKILLYLSPDSNGDIGFLNIKKDFEPTLIFSNRDKVSFLERDTKLRVNKGTLEINKNKKIFYKNGYSNGYLILRSNSEVKINPKGLSGSFKVFQKETGFVVGEVEGENLIVLSTEELNERVGDNVVVFSDNFVNKFIKGDVKYKDNAYEFTVETDKANVEIKPGSVKFLEGKGKIIRMDKTINVENDKLLVLTFLEKENKDKSKEIEKSKSEIIISTKKENIKIDKVGGIKSIAKENSAEYNIYNSLGSVDISEFDKEQLALYNTYLIGGIDDDSAAWLARNHKEINLKMAIPFLNNGFFVLSVIDFMEKGVTFDKAKAYLDVGVEAMEIIPLIDEDISPLEVKKYSSLGVETDLNQLVKLNIPDKVIKDYQEVLKKYPFEKYYQTSFFRGGYISRLADISKVGELYARLHYYNIKPKQLDTYLNTLLKPEHSLKFTIALRSIDDFVELMRLKILPDTIVDYFDKGGYNFGDILSFYKAGMKPNEMKEYQKIVGSRTMGRVDYGVKLEEVREYNEAAETTFDYKEIAELKDLGVKPKGVKEFLKKYNNSLEGSSEFKKQYEERMNELNLKVEGENKKRYSLPTLDLVSRNWNSEKADKPVALVILNRNDWNGAFLNIDELYYSLSDKYYLLITEASEEEEAQEQLKKAKEKFGAISFVLIGGHGEPSQINLGDGDGEKYYIDNKDKDFFNVLKDSTRDGAVVVLQSCSAGKGDSSIAEELSMGSQRTVFAPTCPSNIRRFVLGDKGVVDVEYVNGVQVTRKFEPKIKQLNAGK